MSCPKIGLHIKTVNMEIKENIINEYVIGGMSLRALEKKYGISRSTINRWVRIYEGVQDTNESLPKCVNLSEMKKEPKEILPAEVAELQRQLEQARLYNKLLVAMIDIAEQDLKIPIRKKYGTRQLKK